MHKSHHKSACETNTQDRYRKPPTIKPSAVKPEKERDSIDNDMTTRENNPKYVLIGTGRIFRGVRVYRIKALRKFGDINAGDIGGCISGKHNLSHDGNCWIEHEAVSMGDGRVQGDAVAHDRCVITQNGILGGSARIHGRVVVCGDACVTNKMRISGNTVVGGKLILDYDEEIDGQDDLSMFLYENPK